MTENELVVYYRNQYFEILAVSGPDGLYRSIVAETTTDTADYWELGTAGFKTAHALLLSYVGEIMDYVDEAKGTA